MDQNIIKSAHEAFEMYLSFNNSSDKRLLGMFEKKDNGQYQIKDIRMSDFSRIEQYKVMDCEGIESEPMDERRFNVATSRSRSTTLIISDIDLLGMNSINGNVRTFISKATLI